MTAASEMSRIHHEVLMDDLLAFGEQCESYFTPSLSSVCTLSEKKREREREREGEREGERGREREREGERERWGRGRGG
jgi:hypothetical protein